MIPTKLILRNFLPYKGAIELDLRTIRVACIAGDNGAGKSSLLDAITWALWGKARGAAERDLMSLGTTEMGVDYQFLLGQQEYRILRRRRRRGNSPDVAQLEVQLRAATDLEEDTGSWQAITGDTVRETQQLLNRIVGMEYDTFINSAFILQGRADEFTVKGATERKQVLADILGLGQYDELAERARARRREAETTNKQIDGQLEQIAAELLRRPAIESELVDLSQRRITSTQAIAAHTTALEQLQAQRSELEQRAATVREATLRRDELAQELERLQQRLVTTTQRLATMTAIIADAPAIRAGYQELQASQQAEQLLGLALGELNLHQRQLHEAEREVERQRGNLLKEQHALDHELTQLSQQQEQLPALEQTYATIAQRMKVAQQADEQKAVLNQQLQQATGEIGGCRAENQQLRNEMVRLKDLQTQIDSAAAVCPVCRRPVTATEQQHIHDDYQAEGEELKQQFVQNKQRMQELEQTLTATKARLEQLTVAAREAVRLGREEGDLRRQVTIAREAGVRHSSVLREREKLSERLRREEYAPEAKARVVAVQQAIAAIRYDAAHHQALREQVQRLKPFDQRFHHLAQAEQALGAEQERLADDQRDQARRTQQHASEEARIASLQGGLEQLPALLVRFDDLTQALDMRKREDEMLAIQQGRLEESLRRFADLDEQEQRLRTERRTAADAAAAYTELARAFGKSGIQAMIIETAVPELQDEANTILANMPGNSMRVEFRTQRTTQKGDTVEALEIIISDEVGQRDYAMYSGGEAFRINFAIRVALAKLLARRAGAKLQMLVIDEGFGTQDARGRDSLVEAIRSIEGEFATILVITHVQELRELFPTQILVEKGSAGSQIAVL